MEILVYVLSLLSLWLTINLLVMFLRNRFESSELNVEVKYGVLLLVRRRYRGVPSTKENTAYVYIMIGAYIIALVLSINVLVLTIYTSLIVNTRSLVVLLPGLNVTGEDLVYLIFALAIGAFIHEFLHAKISLKTSIPVKTYGLILALILPIAFVEIDEEVFVKAKRRVKVAVLSAGVAANLILALIATTMVQLTVSPTGFTVVGVEGNSLAEKSGFLVNDVVYRINGSDATLENLRNYLSVNESTILVFELYRPGAGFMNITVLKQPYENKLGVFLAPAPSRSIIALMDPGFFIQLFKLMYWFYIVNFSLVFFNTLPLFITDGGRIVKEILGEKIGDIVNYVGLLLVILMIALSAKI
ncbi:MAG: M50 family metallopeptidase [Desulfurococcaceae archaeon]